jgi:ribosome-associated toxin RatA of RatAB toxin-antitoxin module
MRRTGSVTEGVPEPADDVFAFITDVDRLPEWNAIIAEVVERPDAVQQDAEWVVQIKAMGTSWRSRSKVEDYDPQRRAFSYRSCTDDGNPSYAIWRWQIEPEGDRASRVTVGWDLQPATFWRRVLLSRVRGRQLRQEVPASIGALSRAMSAPAA